MIDEKLTAIADNMAALYTAGQQAEYDRFWDAFQKNGTLTNYTHAFAGVTWTEETMQPKHPVKVVGWCERMFFKNQCSTLLARDKFDFSQMTDCNYLFAESMFHSIDYLDFSGCNQLFCPFYYMPKLHTIGLLKLRADGSQTFSADWMYTPILENITIEGQFGNDVSFHLCPCLSRQSIESIVNALSPTTTGKTLTLRLEAVDNAFYEPDGEGSIGSESLAWYLLCQSVPNWNIELIE